ncbi:MAG: hypothetical protein HKN42_18775 [Granulosicoccus sp.]|nr:hypothetical protein [Granulosicoccus sp.]
MAGSDRQVVARALAIMGNVAGEDDRTCRLVPIATAWQAGSLSASRLRQ